MLRVTSNVKKIWKLIYLQFLLYLNLILTSQNRMNCLEDNNYEWLLNNQFNFSQYRFPEDSHATDKEKGIESNIDSVMFPEQELSSEQTEREGKVAANFGEHRQEYMELTCLRPSTSNQFMFSSGAERVPGIQYDDKVNLSLVSDPIHLNQPQEYDKYILKNVDENYMNSMYLPNNDYQNQVYQNHGPENSLNSRYNVSFENRLKQGIVFFKEKNQEKTNLPIFSEDSKNHQISKSGYIGPPEMKPENSSSTTHYNHSTYDYNAPVFSDIPRNFLKRKHSPDLSVMERPVLTQYGSSYLQDLSQVDDLSQGNDLSSISSDNLVSFSMSNGCKPPDQDTTSSINNFLKINTADLGSTSQLNVTGLSLDLQYLEICHNFQPSLSLIILQQGKAMNTLQDEKNIIEDFIFLKKFPKISAKHGQMEEIYLFSLFKGDPMQLENYGGTIMLMPKIHNGYHQFNQQIKWDHKLIIDHGVYFILFFELICIKNPTCDFMRGKYQIRLILPRYNEELSFFKNSFLIKHSFQNLLVIFEECSKNEFIFRIQMVPVNEDLNVILSATYNLSDIQ